MGGGRENPILMFTSAMVGIGTTITNAERVIPQSNFFILLPPALYTASRLFLGPFSSVYSLRDED
jgi:hypothetical protein